MPTDETRRLLRVFGVAVTTFEDKVAEGAAPEDIAKAETEARDRLADVAALIDRLGAMRR